MNVEPQTNTVSTTYTGSPYLVVVPKVCKVPYSKYSVSTLQYGGVINTQYPNKYRMLQHKGHSRQRQRGWGISFTALPISILMPQYCKLHRFTHHSPSTSVNTQGEHAHTLRGAEGMQGGDRWPQGSGGRHGSDHRQGE